jgi:hypothetical protein
MKSSCFRVDETGMMAIQPSCSLNHPAHYWSTGPVCASLIPTFRSAIPALPSPTPTFSSFRRPPATLTAIFYVFPVACPLFSPCKWTSTHHTDLLRQPLPGRGF